MNTKQSFILLLIFAFTSLVISWNRATNPPIPEPVPLIPGTNLAEYTETDVLAHPNTVSLSCVVDNKYPAFSGTLGRYVSSTAIQFYSGDDVKIVNVGNCIITQ